GRQVNVQARAEADHAEALSGLELLALADVAADAARNQPGDLHDAEVAVVGRADDKRLTFVVFAGLIQGRVEELARRVFFLDHGAGDRRAVHVAIEDAHEHADARHAIRPHAELRRQGRRADHLDDAVRRADDEAGARRRYAV